MVVWCPDWPVVAAGAPLDVPAAVLFANRVVACTPAARGEGVHRGLRRREAQARCPQLTILEHDPSRDASAFEVVAAAVESFAPRVEVVRPGLCAVPTRGPSRYFGGDDPLSAKVAAAVAGLGFGCRVGIADGRFTAGLAARAGRVVEPDGSAAFLAPFPVSTLDRPDLADLLRRLGLRALGDFAALQGADVLARFGTDGATAHRLARGLDDRPHAARIPPPDFVAAMELDPPAQAMDVVAFAAKTLADTLHARLAEQGLACTRIAIEAETEHGESLSRLWRHDGALTPGAVAERVRWQMDGWLHSADGAPTAGITLIRLVPDEVHHDSGRQQGFWGGAAEGDERAARALARVQGMLGPDAVCTAVVGGGRSPAEQVRLVPWGDAREPARPGVAAVSVAGVAGAGVVVSGVAARPGVPARPGVAVSGVAAVSGVPVSGVTGGGGAAPSLASGRAARPAPRRSSANPAGWREVPPWPGQVPAPAPATVHPSPLPAEVASSDGRPVAVTGRGSLTAPPARLSVAGRPWQPVAAWAGPWLVDERWWDPAAHRRRARFQLQVAGSGAAFLAAVESGRWWVEAAYD